MKIVKTFFIFISLAMAMCLISCGRPSNVLNEKEMVNLMVDMQLTEAYVNTQGSFTAKEKEEFGKKVLASHKVSEEELDSTLAWYGKNMDDYSRLFEKVDKEIDKRRKRYAESDGTASVESDNLWIYGEHLILSPLSGYDSFFFSIPYPELGKGEIITLSFYLPNSTTLKNTFGVEYQDGFGEALVNNSTRNKVEVELQTDSSKVVSRIFGTIHVKDTKSLPLYLDSISIKGNPIDTLSYHSKRRALKKFGPL